MAAGAPHYRAVIPRVLGFWSTAIEGVPTDTTNIISSVPCPRSHRMPALDLDLEGHGGLAVANEIQQLSNCVGGTRPKW